MNRLEELSNVIDNLNEKIIDNKFFENLGMSFNFSTNGYVDIIYFGDIELYNSEMSNLYYTEMNGQELKLSLYEFVRKEFYTFKDELFNISLI